MLYSWQSRDWSRLANLRDHLPHALLLQALPGTGEIELAFHFAQGLLCEAVRSDLQPCGKCTACQWFIKGNHPDFRAVYPEIFIGLLSEEAKSDNNMKKKPNILSKEIKIEQVRHLIDFANLGSHRHGNRVAVLYPAESLNMNAANALLKTLEEPPEGVIFILVTTGRNLLLPTILSRCRRIVLSRPDIESSTQWLMSSAVLDYGEAMSILTEAGGAPLHALLLSTPEERLWRNHLLIQLEKGAALDVFTCAEKLYKRSLIDILVTLQRWCFDLLSARMTGVIRFFPARIEQLERCGHNTDNLRLLGFLRELEQQREFQNHPLNKNVLLEALFLKYQQLFTDVGSV
ncbi:DNA polymerase III subunit delta' [Candidatus Pandoraea novymonadis]|uniref:DNA polymerase III subunit delta n=1 Tax=Candidatus Pandoraea novymonadis TaxID=1808959 RepID=A0ABX5FEI6_9BURK|nr:DNA polymerase III subunit delta' [Candidatus Pandoraea novymonadis]PSB92121.1 DNA polymerase III subunit delta' [Candidatus Pandoraea novymonadis]